MILMFPANQFYMAQALLLAKRGRLSVSPNPMVGCVIVKNGRIIGEGWHKFPGDKHAEINALDQAGINAKDATVYVTLEPCCHVGRTGACTESLLKAQVSKVIIAAGDPNPQVAGKGIERLQEAGIQVECGLLQQEAIKLNTIFFHYHQNHLPYVIAKWGMSLDGQLQTQVSDSKQITNQASQKAVHNLRNQVDAIIVGRNTLVADNPKLTVRMTDSDVVKHPLRIVLSKTADVPLNAHLFNDHVAETILFTSEFADQSMIVILQNKGIECIVIALNSHGELDLTKALQVLANKGITSVLVEGGKTILSAFFAENLIDEVHSYIAPVIVKGLEKKKYLDVIEQGFYQDDYVCIAKAR